MRNEDRLGITPNIDATHVSSVAPKVEKNISIFNFPTPTEIVSLPSMGKYYPKGSNLHGVENIEIKVMTAKEEDILLNESYLKTGVVIDKLLQSVMVDKSLNLDNFLVGDRNAILFATRASGIGAEYRANISCQSCGVNQEKTFNLTEIKNKDLSENPLIKETEKGTFLIELPKTKFNVEFRLLTGVDEKELTTSSAKKKKYNLPEDRLIKQLDLMVCSINEVEDRTQIKLCIENLPAIDCRYLRKCYEEVSPDLDLKFSHTCSKCDVEQEVTLPLTAEFFWSK